VIAFSTTDRASFEAVAMWKSKVEAECGDIAVALVQNKVDLVDQAVVSATEVETLARKLGLKLYRTCVKEGINVTEVSNKIFLDCIALGQTCLSNHLTPESYPFSFNF
jgi:Ras-related protein Rab-23